MTPEFSHIVRMSEIGTGGVERSVAANEKERQALTKRFDLISLGVLTASFTLQLDGHKVDLSGTIVASLEQPCSISGEAVSVSVREPFEISFIPKTQSSGSEEEIELAADDCDVIEYDGNKVDVGEAIAQTLYLSLDPFLRGPNADAVAEQRGLKSEEEAGPFGALASLKDKLG